MTDTITAVGLRGLTLASKFLLLIFLARNFEPSQFGAFGLVVATLSIALPFMGLEFHYFANRLNAVCTPEALVQNIRNTVVLYLLLYTAFGVVVSYANFVGLIPKQIFLVTLCLTPLEHLSNELTRLLYARSKAFLANAVLFVRTAAWVYLVLAIYWVSPKVVTLNTIFGIWFCFAAASILLSSLYLRKLPWRFELKHFPDKQWIKNGVKIASPFLVSMILAVFSVYIDRFYIASYIGLEGVGVYTFFAGFATALHTLTNTGVQLVYIPKMLTAKASGDIDEIKRQSFSLAFATTIAIAFLVITALFAIEPVLRFVEHEKYVSHIAIFYILTCSVIFRALADVPSAILYVFKKDKSILVANLGAFGAACVGNTLFMPLMGLAGAAVAATLTALVLFIITVVSCKRTFVISDSLL